MPAKNSNEIAEQCVRRQRQASAQLTDRHVAENIRLEDDRVFGAPQSGQQVG